MLIDPDVTVLLSTVALIAESATAAFMTPMD